MICHTGPVKQYSYCEVNGQRYTVGCNCQSCIAFRERKAIHSKENRKTHPMKDCHCESCEKKRTHNRELMRRKYEGHSLKVCHCPDCERRRINARRNYPEKKIIAYQRRWAFKDQIVRMLGGKCAFCGFVPIDNCQIDLHERNGRVGRTRNGGIVTPAALNGVQYGRKQLLEHIDEIIPLCRNCHVRLTCFKCREEVKAKLENWRRPA